MVTVSFSEEFAKQFKKIKNGTYKEKAIKQLKKIQLQPTIGKPMRYERKGKREVYIKPYRLSYHYDEKTQHVVILDLHHKDDQ